MSAYHRYLIRKRRPVKKEDTLSEKKGGKNLTSFRSIILNLSILFLISILLLYFSKQLNDQTIEIGHIGIPESLIEKGYSEKVVRNLIKDEIGFINNVAVTEISKKDIKPDIVRSEIKISILNSDVPLDDITEILKYSLDIKNDLIDGEVIVIEKDSLSINFRSKGIKVTVKGLNKDFENLLSKAVLQSYKIIAPYVVAVFERNEGRDWDCLETIKSMLSDETIENDKWAWNLWGLLLLDMNFISDSKIKFEEALKLDSNFYVAHFNLGLLYAKDSAFDNAIGQYRKVLSINNGFEDAKSKLVDIEISKENYTVADSMLTQYINNNDRFGEYYFLKSRIAIAEKDSLEAFEGIQKALFHSPNSSKYNFTQGIIYLIYEEYDLALQYLSNSYRNEKELNLLKLKSGQLMEYCMDKLEYGDLSDDHKSKMDSLELMFVANAAVDVIVNKNRMVNF